MTTEKKIRIVLIEDSPTVQQFLSKILEQIGCDVVGKASSVAEGLEVVFRKKPDIVFADVLLEDGDALVLTEKIMEVMPMPVVLTTAYSPKDPELMFRALKAGALDILPKPPPEGSEEFMAYIKNLQISLRAFKDVPLIKKRFHQPSKLHHPGIADRTKRAFNSKLTPLNFPIIRRQQRKLILLIGASTGGPPIIAQILKNVRIDLLHSIYIAQHMHGTFVNDFRRWLGHEIQTSIQYIYHGRHLQQGVFLPPPFYHAFLTPMGTWATIRIKRDDDIAPSIDKLFQGFVHVMHKYNVCALLLTGMGCDGALGLKKLAEHGAITIVQEPSTADVAFMPIHALELEHHHICLNIDNMVKYIQNLLVKK